MFISNFVRRYFSKFIIGVLVVTMVILFWPHVSMAQGSGAGTALKQQLGAFAGEQGANLGAPSDPRLVVGRIIKVFLGLLGTLFLAYAVYAGYLIMSSGGESDKVNKGKSTLKTAALGVFVIFSVYSILYFVLGSVWFATTPKSDVYFEAGVGTQPYDFCRDGRGDPISCPPVR